MTKSGMSDFFFTILISPYLTGQPACLEECFWKKISSSSKMISIQGCRRPHRECSSGVPSVASFVAPLDSFPPSKSEISKQPNKPLGPKSPADTSVPKYSEDHLQRIFKAVLEAWAPASTPTPAPVVFEVPREKLKARSPNVYYKKSHIDCYNFCQQCEDYFTTQGSQNLPKFFLPRPSSETGSAPIGSNTSRDMTPIPLFRSRGTSLRRSSIKTWVIPKSLWIPHGEKSRRTPSIN